MHLAHSLDCSFLDLSNENDESGYDSPSSSQEEDEPLDAKVLPLPPRNTNKRIRLRKRHLYHNEHSSERSDRQRQRSFDSESMECINLFNLSDIDLPLEDGQPPLSPPDWSIQPPSAAVSASSSYSSLLQNIRDQCARYQENRRAHSPAASYQSTLKNSLETTTTTHKNDLSPEPSDLKKARSSSSNLTTIQSSPINTLSDPMIYSNQDLKHQRSCSITLLSSCSLSEPISQSMIKIPLEKNYSSSSCSSDTTIINSTASVGTHTTTTTNYEILISTTTLPLSDIHPNLISTASPSSALTTSTSNKFKTFDKSVPPPLTQKNLTWAVSHVNHHPGKENLA
ncbi:hypothetical protein PSTG_09858 [Puccinia striiformis f. sp. tritici PST-78]|uniref:Uncharacterized protein n=1 Tax=Puccinia striiformis f. sp. tritici PST-78 TaxID=1165861 RepID=A0A0L0VC77_9BASI|nr:hypothetical protein PSTG_09858 [Puccinia striiformis f. sp. tritici PST-78]